MSWLQVKLSHFVQIVPICKMPISPEKMIGLLIASRKKALIVLNEQDYVLGIVESHRISSIVNCTNLRLEEILSPVSCQYEKTTIGEFLQTRQEEEKNIYVVRDSQGKCLGIVDPWLLLKYIQENQTVQEKEEYLSETEMNILQQWPIPVMIQDKNGEIIYCNSRWEKDFKNALPLEILLLYKASKLETSQKLYKHQIDCLKDTLYLGESYRGGTTVSSNSLDFRSLSLEEEEHWQFLYFPFSGENTTSVKLILALSKQTDQKTADLLQLNRLKDDLLSCISHELKSPLTTVVGLANLLKQEKIGELNTRQMKYAESIYNNGRQLMTLVNNLLDLTHLEAGGMTLILRPVKIRQVCEQAYGSIVAKYQSKGQPLITFHLDIEFGLNEIIADETRLHQMLVHLMDNAVKFTLEEGEFGLKVFRRENWLVFRVWDTGVGIALKAQPLLLQGFQSENGLSKIGLGLVLTQRLALLHGGDLSFVSEVSQGTQFTLLLPISQEINQNTCHSLVLIADSTSQTIEPIKQILTKLGYWITVARTGTEALDKARRLQPSIIFINPLLSLLSGWDLLKLIKGDTATEKIKIIITATRTEEKQAYQMRADGFLSLPLIRSSLEKILEKFRPSVKDNQNPLTILHLNPADSTLNFKALLESLQIDARILEADDLEQAELLAQVWHIDCIFLDFQLIEDLSILESLKKLALSSTLSNIPLITFNLAVLKAAKSFTELKIVYTNLENFQQSLQALTS